MNTDKIYAEAIANEYAPKEASKVLALKKLDMKAKSKANIFAYTFGVVHGSRARDRNVPLNGRYRRREHTGSRSRDSRGDYRYSRSRSQLSDLTKLLDAGKRKYAFEIVQLAREISESAE